MQTLTITTGSILIGAALLIARNAPNHQPKPAPPVNTIYFAIGNPPPPAIEILNPVNWEPEPEPEPVKIKAVTIKDECGQPFTVYMIAPEPATCGICIDNPAPAPEIETIRQEIEAIINQQQEQPKSYRYKPAARKATNEQ